MRQLVKWLMVIIALTACQSQSATDPSSSTSKENNRERLLRVLDQSRPNEYVPAAFFLHFKDKLGSKSVQNHRDFYLATHMDFVKVFFELDLPHIDILTGKEWAEVPVFDEDFFAPQVALVEELARQFASETFILATVYSPLMMAHMMVGEDKDLKRLAALDPEAFGQAIKNLSLSIEKYQRLVCKHGADGFYVSSFGGNCHAITTEMWRQQVRPWDKHVSEVADEIGEINILHICDYDAPFQDAEALYAFADYPASIINVPLKYTDGSLVDMKEAQQRFGRPIFGGLDRYGTIAKGTIEEAKAEVDKVMENASPNFMLGADCTVPGDTDWEKLRAIIDYAHTWRQTHKK